MRRANKTIPTRKILQIILFAHLLLFFRIWQISYLAQNQYKAFAYQPRKRVIVEKPQRGAIVDRRGKALAQNRISYNAAIYYRDLKQLPGVKWENRTKRFPRKEYIKDLSHLLGELLSMDEERIEDLIYSKAALFPHLPFVIKENISEKQYYRIRALEKDWLGLHAEKGSTRHYPFGRVGCDIIGYVGSINQREYLSLAQEIKELQTIATNDDLPIPAPYHSLEEVITRLRQLREKAYSVSDRVGKSGIEAAKEKELRGYAGISNYEINKKGTFLQKLPTGKKAISGATCQLTISSELQAYAETLLIESEKNRDPLIPVSWRKNRGLPQKAPWIRGGGIVAMDPNTGEILALASYPRCNPNDFSSVEGDKKEILKWLESPHYIAAVWDGLASLSKETIEGGEIEDLHKELTWEGYLEALFSPGHPLIEWLQKVTLSQGAKLQEDMERALFLTKTKEPLSILSSLLFEEGDVDFSEEDEIYEIGKSWQELLPLSCDPRDLLFSFDLIRLCMDSSLFSDELLKEIGHLTLGQYFHLRQKTLKGDLTLQREMLPHFETMVFSDWRKKHQKSFLQEKRREEKRRKRAARPYLDYIDAEKKRQFQAFWKENGKELFTYFLENSPNQYFSENDEYKDLLILSRHLGNRLFSDFLRTVKSFSQLSRPLYSNHSSQIKTQKDLASLFYPKHGFGYSKSYAFTEACVLGSIFKIVTAYAALEEGMGAEKFIMTDLIKWDQSMEQFIVGYDEKGKAYPRYFKGGRLPRSSKKHIGKIDMVEAMAQSSNPYFSLLATDYLSRPNNLRKAASLFGFGEKTGINLPRETSGKLPDDLEKNQTGLYSFAIGQHSFVATPLQTACMLSSLCHGKLFEPKIIESLEGLLRDSVYPVLADDKTPFARESLLLGIPFTPIARNFYEQKERKVFYPAKVRREIFFSPQTQKILFDGMKETIWGKKGTARGSINKQVLQRAELQRCFQTLKNQVIGKTSTSEIMQKTSFEPTAKAERYKDVWFGAISFDKEKPELVVVVYLRFANYGREAVPYTMQMIEKFRELKKTNSL